MVLIVSYLLGTVFSRVEIVHSKTLLLIKKTPQQTPFSFLQSIMLLLFQTSTCIFTFVLGFVKKQ